MTTLPLRRITITNFRRLGGTWDIPLDAPVVLIHGPNGTGKTSILSAIEMALTGQVRSMKRLDERYTAHLPHRGAAFATLGVATAGLDGALLDHERLTVAGDRVEGMPALDAVAAQFFSERAFLDQASLGRLLELYQHAERNQESSLARFVNELLGLDQLDALRSGLDDANHVTRLRRLSSRFADAERQLEAAARDLEATSKELTAARRIEVVGRNALIADLIRLELQPPRLDGTDWLRATAALLEAESSRDHTGKARGAVSALAELRGRIRGHSARTSVGSPADARAALGTTESKLQAWRSTHGEIVASLWAEAAQLGQQRDRGALPGLESEIRALDSRLRLHDSAQEQSRVLQSQLEGLQAETASALEESARVQAEVGGLASGLAAIRDQVVGDICPVCDRNFREVSENGLSTHVDEKIQRITDRGRELRTLEERRSALSGQQREVEQRLSRATAEMLSGEESERLWARLRSLVALQDRLQSLEAAIALGTGLEADLARHRSVLAEIESADVERTEILRQLRNRSEALGVPHDPQGASPELLCDRLLEIANTQLTSHQARADLVVDARRALDELSRIAARNLELSSSLAALAESKVAWEDAITGANQRRAIARSVHAAASATRTEIVQRVFTRSLNEVWRDVFTRLAPAEPYVPAFGIPSSSRMAMTLELETVHRSGGTAGTPAMMLSAGNLNTAALSLFVALHLAVDPLLPCLVLDDPVQSMDEVHVSQFAGLLRVLAKHHGRQLIVAVHERELFDYLTLELSPAFEGDQLITHELSRDSDGDSELRSTRLGWAPDVAIAG